ncbi:MAG: hypothetical protein GX856_09030 [Gammaproteobacteria bacterium]|nr:hypothetical protein [Gammaproteobacteria bacterium]
MNVFPSHTSRVAPPRRRSTPAATLTRIQAGMPQALPAAAHDVAPGRTRRHSGTYTRGGYLARSRQASRSRQPLFRIG